MKTLISTLLFLSFTFCLTAQIAVNTTGASPNSRSAVDIDFPGKGLLVPRMDESTRDTITNVPLGLMIFNTTTNCFNMWDGSTWKQGCFDCSFPIPTVGNNGPICEGSTLNLTATTIPGASYAWSGPNGFSSSQQNPSIANASTGANGIYSLQVTLNGCTSDPISTTATVNASPTTPVVSSNSPVCNGGTLTLGATSSGGATFSWAGPNGYSASGASQTISPAGNNNAGTYTVTADVNGCSTSNSIAVVINDIPTAPTKINGDSTPCANTANVTYTTPSVMGATSYTWTVPAGSSITSGQGTNSITADLGSTNGNICVSATNTCGTSSQTCEGVTLGGAGSGSQTFSFNGGEQTFTVPPCVTSITLEAWGAQGGAGYPQASPYSQAGGKGGYATGTLTVTPGQILYVNVGGQGAPGSTFNGTNSPNAGGYNGGGIGNSGGGGGGGASHVASASGVLSALAPGNVFIVAGAGGGGVWTNCTESNDTEGGAGGGLSGAPTPTGACGTTPGAPGTQSAGGSSGGSFGQGGDYTSAHSASANDPAGGGGGWYGGGAAPTINQVGGGGSSYIGGVTGGSTIDGLSTMPNPSGGNMTGNSGNGVVKISW